MVSSPKLSTHVLQNIAAQIAERVSHESELAAPGAQAGLGESLRVAMLTQDQIDDGLGSLANRIVETGQWHHQIYLNNAATSFARSIETLDSPGMPFEVVEVADSTIVEDLRSTIAWVDANVDQEAEAEVLIAPSHLLTGLWLHGPDIDAVVVSSIPAGMKGIVQNELISGEQFLATLASIPAIEGLGLPDDLNTQLTEGA